MHTPFKYRKSSTGESDNGGTTRAPLVYRLMQKLGSVHTARLKEAQKEFGVERHLFGLQKILALYQEELEMGLLPVLFTDPSYLKMRHDFISTRNMTHPQV